MFHIQFKTDNAAFQGDALDACADVLETVVPRLRDGMNEGTVRDINGNAIGAFSYAGDEIRADLSAVLQYMWAGEMRDYSEQQAQGSVDGHIFESMRRLRLALESGQI